MRKADVKIPEGTNIKSRRRVPGLVAGVCLSLGAHAAEVVPPDKSGASIFENPWVIVFMALGVLAVLYLFFKNFTRLRIENFESFTSHNEIIIKVRTLSILSLTLFPLTEYYESVYLKLYPTDWLPVWLISLVALISLALSFVKNLPFAFVNFLPQASYYVVYGLLAYKSLKAGMLPIMAVETACIILFSKLIFSKLKTLLYFISFVALTNFVLLLIFNIQQSNLDIHISATIQASIVSIALYLIEGSANRKVAFGSKTLEGSNLFVLVADSNANFVFVNGYLESVTGLTQAQILKEGWWDYLGYDKATTDGLKKVIKENIANNLNTTYDSTIKDRYGNIIYVSWVNSIIEEKYQMAVGKNVTEARLMQMEEDRRKEKMNRYNQVVHNLTTVPYTEKDNLEEILKNISRSVAKAMETDRVGIWRYEDDTLTCLNCYLLTKDDFEAGERIYRISYPSYFKAISEARIIDAPDVQNNPDTAEFTTSYFKPNNIKSLLDIPVFINGLLIGVLCCKHADAIKIWDTEDINFAKAAADFVSLSIEAAKRKELEREYRYILNNVGDIIYTTDASGNFEFINKTAANLLGYDIADLKGKHFTQIIHPDYRERVAMFYLRQFKQRTETTYYEFKVLTSQGRDYWVGQNVKLVIDKRNPDHIRGFQAVVRDINKQKETELALINSENNFRQINENINEVFYLYNFEKKKYDYISPNCKTILGVDPSFFYEGNNFNTSYVVEEDRAAILEMNASGGNKERYDIEYRILTDDNIRWIKEKSFPIKDENGVVIKKSGVCADVTERKSQKQRLKQLSLVAQTVSNGVVITNNAGLIEWCNDSFSALTEYSLDELIGKRPIEIFSGKETPPEIRKGILENKLANNNVEIIQYTKSGIPKWFLITNTPLLNDKGEVEKYIEIVTDITERKALEREYRYILDNAGDIIYTTDERGYVEFLNQSVTKILGYEPSELTGKHFTHIIHPDEKKKVSLFYYRQFIEKREDSYLEFRVINKSGDVNWVGQNVKLIQNAGNRNKVKGFQSILRDITRQKEAESALVESENNFRQISEAINDVFYLYNVAEDKYDYVSQNAPNILGVDAIYFYYVNNYVADYVIEKDRTEVLKAYKNIKTGSTYEIEYRIRIGQEIRWIKEKSFAIQDEKGHVVKTSGTFIDITQKKMQEKRLLKINKELSIYSEDLAINNLLKEQLIYSNNFDEIAKVSLNTLKMKIPGIARGSLFLVNDNKNGFDVFYLENNTVKRNTYDFSDVKSYQSLKQGKNFIEYNVDLTTNLSRSDRQRRQENIISYIMLPINYSTELIGALGLGFETQFSLTKREIDILENFTSVLSVVVNKLKLQNELADKSKDILASLNYARSIQQSILPNINLHKEAIKNFMRLYVPKDVVSGDFYVIESFDEYTMIALGDCTGHGVPGAFLTLLGSNFLQRIAVENKVTSAVTILELLDYQLFTMLNKNREETIRDGMELGVCIYNRNTKSLTFAGAGLFLVYYRDNEQFVVQGSKRSIGDENHSKIDFEEMTIQLNGTEKFYMFSDGYRDQLGGVEKRKRFSRARFFELLHKIKNLPPFQQEYLLKLEHAKHRGKLEQTDDISVIGFELK